MVWNYCSFLANYLQGDKSDLSEMIKIKEPDRNEYALHLVT
jgi:hypothetical protein